MPLGDPMFAHRDTFDREDTQEVGTGGYRCAVSGPGDRRARAATRRSRLSSSRQVEDESGMARSAGRVHGAAVGGDDGVDDGESESGAAGLAGA